MYRLLAGASYGAIVLLGATPAFAQTVKVETARTTPIATSTANNGARADIEITAAGSVKPAAGAAVTVDSANNVSNAGTIQITGANGSTGVLVTAAGSGTITNTGKIILDEDYTPTDADSDGDADGAFALGSNRFGIRTGDGIAFTGSISHSGEITVEGNDSGGIRVGGPLQGALSSTGTISVTGDRSVGIATQSVSGGVTIRGSIAARGKDAVGVAIDGDVGGRLVLQGAVAATGYRNTTAPADASKLDADDLLQGGPAVRVAGSVGGGILLDIAPADNNANDTDEDDDGIADASEGNASITAFGAAPALEIGSAQAIAIGAVAGDTGGHGLVIKGSVAASGVYADVNSVALSIGGKGGTVDLGGGIRLSGSVSAGSQASATAIRIGAGTSMNDITSSGNISAAAGSKTGNQARGVEILAGASVPLIVNSGGISATASGEGTATAIYDATGTLARVDNTGTIKAVAGAGKAVALDLRQNGTGVLVRQLASATAGAVPSIAGDVLLGSGDDVFEIADGDVSGKTDFGAGNNRLALSGDATLAGSVVFGAGADQLTLAGTSAVAADIDFGGGADTLAIGSGASLRGKLSNGATLAATVDGTLDATNAGAVQLGSLAMSQTGVLGVTIDGTAGTATQYQVSGAASFAAGSKVLVHLTGLASSVGTHTILQAGTLTGGENLGLEDLQLPFLFKGTIAANAAAGTIQVGVARKSAAELSLNRSESSAFDAIFAVVDKDAQLTQTFLDVADSATLRREVGTFLPDHAGGIFESATQASRAASRIAQDPVSRASAQGNWNLWVQQIAWGTNKDVDDTAAYDVSGWGLNAGLETRLGNFGWIGGSLGFYLGLDNNGANDNEVETGEYEAAIHWRARYGGLGLYARASAALLDFDGTRRIDGSASGIPFSRISDATWGGRLYSLAGGVSYEASLGRLKLKPRVTGEYFRVTENGYTESGGGQAFDLIVDKRVSDEAAVTPTLTIGYDLGSTKAEGTWLRVEAEGGQRFIVGGALGATTARFATGDPFTLQPGARDDGWVARARFFGGVDMFGVGLELGAEEQQGRAELAGRLSVQVGW